MKGLRSIGLILVCALLLPAVCFGVYRLATDSLAGDNENACRGSHATYYVMIAHNTVTPRQTDAHRCDRLTITNFDSQQRLLAFGPHDHHLSYDGVSERLIAEGQSLTISLVKTGTYSFHDHLDDEHVAGSFTVSP